MWRFLLAVKYKIYLKSTLAVIFFTAIFSCCFGLTAHASEGTDSAVSDDGTSASSDDTARSEHPRPDWEREQWMNLNGVWEFTFDEDEVGLDEGWYETDSDSFDLSINVPYCWESALSGIEDTDYLGQAWYRRTVDLDETWLGEDQTVFLNFGAVDAKCIVYVNGQEVGGHDGGYTSFDLDITDYVHEGTNTITVWVEDKGVYGDDSYTALIGKQGLDAPCGYTHTSGIWQTVYLESRNKTYLEYAHVDTDITEETVTYELSVQSEEDQQVTIAYEFASKLWDEEAGEDVETGSSVSGTQTLELTEGGQFLSWILSIWKMRCSGMMSQPIYTMEALRSMRRMEPFWTR